MLVGTLYLDFESRVPFLEPSKAGNFYQTYSPMGRGFGFDSFRTKTQYYSFSNLPSFTPEVQKTLLNEDMLMTKEKVSKYLSCPEVQKEIVSTLSPMDCQNLGVKKG